MESMERGAEAAAVGTTQDSHETEEAVTIRIRRGIADITSRSVPVMWDWKRSAA
jgi:hypothetical protein